MKRNARVMPWALLMLLTVPFHAKAALCTLNGNTAPAFGVVSTLSTGASTTGTVTANCDLLQTGQIGLSLGLGVGASTNSRYLTGPGGTEIPYNLYSNPGATSVWGNTVGTNTVGIVGIVLPQTFTVYAQIPSGTVIPAVGSYTDTITVTAFANGVSQATNTFIVTLTTVAACTVVGGTLNFGSASLLTANADGTGTLTVNCTNTAPYSVALDNGANYLSGRRMTDGVMHFVPYQLYTDAARSAPWGTAASTSACTTANSCVLGTGSGSAQAVTVYGRVAPQVGLPTGGYTDSVIVTVMY